METGLRRREVENVSGKTVIETKREGHSGPSSQKEKCLEGWTWRTEEEGLPRVVQNGPTHRLKYWR